MSSGRSLLEAVENDDLVTVNSLIQSGDCGINIPDIRGYSPLHLAVKNDHIEIVRCLLSYPDCNINVQDKIRRPPLHLAVLSNNMEMVRCFLSYPDCNVNMQDRLGRSALHLALENNKIETVRCLLTRHDCSINIQKKHGYSPLHLAIGHTCNNDTETVKYLLSYPDCDINMQDGSGSAPLQWAVKYNNIQCVRYLLSYPNCDINIQDRSGDSPLHWAVRCNNIDIVGCLLSYPDCNINIQDSDGKSPLHLAIGDNNIQMVRCLLPYPDCNVNIQNSDGKSPLHLAVGDNKIEMVRWLLSYPDCNINIQDSDGRSPLHLAVENEFIDIVRLLVERGECLVNIKNQNGHSPFSTNNNGLRFLYKLAQSRTVELFHVLIQRNVDVLSNHVENQLQLVKHILSENDFQSFSFSIQNGLYINSLTSLVENIIHILAQYYMDYLNLDLRFLFYYELNCNLLNNDGNSPLMVASLLNNLPFIQFLTAIPCDVNIQNKKGHTALHLSVIGFTLIKEKLNMMRVNSVVTELCARKFYPRYLACIDILLSHGADVNMQDSKGKTVLMLACVKNDSKLLETLLIHGADVNIVDTHGRSALQYIDLTNNVYDLTCFNLLLSHGCRQSFNQPCLNGNTIIQNILQFSPLWQIDQTINFIKFLVFKNVNLHLLTSDDGEISYGQLSLVEFSSQSRHELRQILYLSGGSFEQITQILHFEVEEIYEASLPKTLREEPREKFFLFANNLSLKDICRRVIRQNTGLAIHDRISKLIDSLNVTNFLMFRDIDSKRFSLPVQLESVVYDDDDYNSYDLNMENDDYENDYLVYEDCKYLNEVKAGLKDPHLDADSE